MKIEELIIFELVYFLQNRLKKEIIQNLEKQDVMFFDDKKNECIDNTWEEFCISVQDKTIKKEIKNKIDKYLLTSLENSFNSLLLHEKVAIWIKSEAGTLWLYENKQKSYSLEAVPICFDDCKDKLFNLIIEEAYNFVDDNVYEYLNLSSNTFKDEYDNDDKLVVYE